MFFFQDTVIPPCNCHHNLNDVFITILVGMWRCNCQIISPEHYNDSISAQNNYFESNFSDKWLCFDLLFNVFAFHSSVRVLLLTISSQRFQFHVGLLRGAYRCNGVTVICKIDCLGLSVDVFVVVASYDLFWDFKFCIGLLC